MYDLKFAVCDIIIFPIGEQQRSKLGSSHPDYLDTLQYLAEFYLQRDRLTDAEPILIECLERRKHTLGAEHPDSIHTLDTLANLYDVTGKNFISAHEGWFSVNFL